MSQTYHYVPVAAEQSYEDAMALIESLVAPCRIEPADDFRTHCIHHIKVKSEDGQSTWLMIMKNESFASDPRKFLRIRLNSGIPALTEQLTESTLDAGGYVGECSKEFINAQGVRVFDVEDGEGSIRLSIGEVMTRLESLGITVEVDAVRENANAEVSNLFQKSTGMPLVICDGESPMYRMHFDKQSVAEYQSAPRKQ